MTDTTPVVVTVTGAAGSIGYAAVFRIAAGDMLGPDRPIKLRLLELPQAVSAAHGTAMELQDGAFPLLTSVDIFDDARAAFDGTDFGLGIRSQRYAAVIEDGTLTWIDVEDAPPDHEKTTADVVLSKL